jgi:glucose/arabinose dehydrogenase
LDIVLDPQFSVNRFIYFSYVRGASGEMATSVARARLDDMTLSGLEVIFNAYPMTGKRHHFGSRLLFGLDGTLLITLGDRGQRSWAQDRTVHPGSVVRVSPTGGIPYDNPFVRGSQDGRALFSYGHRNPQGLALNPSTREMWIHEHGPRGGDELNRLNAGGNYGWPVISYGREYWSSMRVGEGTHKPGLAQPFHYWVPSIAPSGMAFYSGKLFSSWKDNLFVGSLKFKTLVRLELGRDRVLHEERLLPGKYGRIRDVREGPNGAIYLLTDAANGKLLRLNPT